MRALGADDRTYRIQKITVLLEALALEGVPIRGALEGGGLSEREVADPMTRASQTQVTACYGSTLRPSSAFVAEPNLRRDDPRRRPSRISWRRLQARVRLCAGPALAPVAAELFVCSTGWQA